MAKWLAISVPFLAVYLILMGSRGTALPAGVIADYTIRDNAGGVVCWVGENPQTGKVEISPGNALRPVYFVTFDESGATVEVAERKGDLRKSWTIERTEGGVRLAQPFSLEVDDWETGGWRVWKRKNDREKLLAEISRTGLGWALRDVQAGEITRVTSRGGGTELRRGDEVVYTCEGLDDPRSAALLAIPTGRMDFIGLLTLVSYVRQAEK